MVFKLTGISHLFVLHFILMIVNFFKIGGFECGINPTVHIFMTVSKPILLFLTQYFHHLELLS